MTRNGLMRGSLAPLSDGSRRRYLGHLLVVVLLAVGIGIGLGLAPAGTAIQGTVSAQEVSPASNHEIPSTPASYFGSVNISGDVPASGLVVEAVVNGEVRGTAAVGSNGTFGGAPTPLPGQYLTVDGNTSDIGKTVTFYLDGPNVPRTAAAETVQWETGDVQAIDLSAPIESPKPLLGNLSVASQGPNATIVEGDEENVTVRITNQGDIGGRFNLTLNISNQVNATASTGLLNGSNQTTISFQNVTGSLIPGLYPVSVQSKNATINGSLTVQAPGDPTPDLADLDIVGQGPSGVVSVKTPQNITVNVTNVGPVAGPLNATLVITNQSNGATELVQTETTGSVAPGDTQQLAFTDVTNVPGTGFYNIAVARGANESNVELVGTMVVSVDVTGDGNLATDVTGESLMADVDGDREFDIFDVQAFFVHHEDPSVQNNPNIFQFDGTPPVDIFDVQALFDRLVEQNSFGSV